MIKIYVSSRFKRSYKKLPQKIQADFDAKIKLFQNNPFDPRLRNHKLKGELGDYYAFYLKDGFRVLVDFQGDGSVILVEVGSHDIYGRL